MSPKRVATHAFYPLLNYSVDSIKIKKDKLTKIIEPQKKKRPISYSSHIDSHIYSYYANKLSNLYEAKLAELNLEDSILAFRSLGKSNIEFAFEAFESIKNYGACGVVALDLTKFFDTLDHNILKKQWADLLNEKYLPEDHYNLFRSISKFSTVDKLKLYETLGISPHNPKCKRTRICEPKEFREVVRNGGLISVNNGNKGIPQGSPISALLSNIYMLKFDLAMKNYVGDFGGFYFRYCDDMLIIVPIEIRDKVAAFVRTHIKELKVDINPTKTEIRTFTKSNGSLVSDKPLQYLGFLFNGENIYLRSASLARYSERMKRGVSFAKATMRKRNKSRINRGEPVKPLYKKDLFDKYSHLGSRNFITYGLRAARIMKSKTIKKQLKPLWKKLQSEIE